jgi:hypothetical protein
LLYGLILFARTLGPDAQLVGVHVGANRPEHLKVWAARVGGDRLRVLLINKGSHPVSLARRWARRRSSACSRFR